MCDKSSILWFAILFFTKLKITWTVSVVRFFCFGFIFFQNTGSNFQRCSASEFHPEDVNGSRTVGCLWQFCIICILYRNKGLALPRVVKHAITTRLSLQCRSQDKRKGTERDIASYREKLKDRRRVCKMTNQSRRHGSILISEFRRKTGTFKYNNNIPVVWIKLRTDILKFDRKTGQLLFE